MLPVTEVPVIILVLCIYFPLVPIHADPSLHTDKSGLDANDIMAYTYIPKLTLTDLHRQKIEEIMLDAKAQRDNLLTEYRAENYEALSISKGPGGH